MTHLNLNIKFTYLYRDGANYKQWGEAVFTNDNCIDFQVVRDRIIARLIDNEWFDAEKWKLPDLHFSNWDGAIDVPMHELDAIEETTESATQGDIAKFLELIEG